MIRVNWRRHAGDPRYHAVAAIVFGGSVMTRCNGRWPEADETETSTNPPHEERCGACQRALIEVMRVEQGLEELFDLGGEG